MKRSICILLTLTTLFCLFTPLAMYAEGEQDKYIFTLNADKESYTLSSALPTLYLKAEIPDTYNSLPVTHIADGAFSECDRLCEIALPSSLQYVGGEAFFGCESLDTVTSASDRFTVDDGAIFTDGGKTLVYVFDKTKVTYTVPSGVETVSPYAFADNSALVSVDIPDTVSKLGSHCFAYCSSLESISLPSSVEEIPEYAFSCCTSLTSFTAEPSVVSVGKGAFNSCTSLYSVLIPDGAAVGEDAFFSCDRLTVYCNESSQAHTVAVSNGVATKNVTYNGASRVDGLQISVDPQTIQTGMTAALNISGLENAQVDDVTIFISDEKKVSYNNGVLSAHSVGTVTVTAVTVDGAYHASAQVTVTDPPSPLASSHPYENNSDETKTYTVPDSPEKIFVTFSDDTHTEKDEDFIYITDKNGESYGVYTASQLAGVSLIINGDTVCVRLTSDDDIVSYGYRIESAVSADGVKYPDSISFDSDTVSLTVSESYKTNITVSPSDAFYGEIFYYSSDGSVLTVDSDGNIYACGAGTAIVSAVTRYGEALAQCDVTVADNAIDGIIYDFDTNGAVVKYCRPESANVTVPDTVNGKNVYKIAKGAFSFNTVIEQLTLPATLTEISKGAFGGNSSLAKININSANTVYISNGQCIMTKNREKLVTVCGAYTEFTVPDTVITVNQEAFAYMYRLTKITLGKNTETLIYGAVESCHALTAIEVSAENTTFSSKNGVLYSKDGKTLMLHPSGVSGDIILTEGIVGIEYGAFYSCKSVNSVTVPSTVTYIAPEAFCGSVTVKTINVSGDNKDYSSYNDALYNKARTTLLAVPPATVGVYTVPDGVRKIANYAFLGCDISGVELPLSLEHIGTDAFYKNRSLSTVVLPPLLERIDSDAFAGCDRITLLAGGNITTMKSSPVGDGTLYAPYGSDTYATAEVNGIAVESSVYLYDDLYGITAVCKYDGTGSYGLDCDVRLVGTGGGDADKYTVTFTHGGERYIPSEEYYITVSTKANLGQTVTVCDRYGECLARSQSKCVSFAGVGGEYYITPSFAAEQQKLLKIKTYPNKMEFYSTESIDTSGLTLYYSDGYGQVKTVSDGFTVKCDSIVGYGKTTVRVTYDSLSVSYTVDIVPKPLTGKVEIKGNVTPGSVLVAEITEISPSDIPYNVTWYVDGVAVQGNNTTEYTLTQNDVGKKIKVRISADDGYSGSFESDEILAGRDQIKSDKYTFDKSNGTVGKLPSQLTVKEFLENIDDENNVVITKNDTVLTDDKLISTGTVISLVYGDVTTVTYTAVVTGDINGDGKISITDFTRLKSILLGTEEKDTYKKKAADVNGDGKISITDFTQVKSHLLGTKEVVPK